MPPRLIFAVTGMNAGTRPHAGQLALRFHGVPPFFTSFLITGGFALSLPVPTQSHFLF